MKITRWPIRNPFKCIHSFQQMVGTFSHYVTNGRVHNLELQHVRVGFDKGTLTSRLTAITWTNS